MAGYIGTKAVALSTTTGNILGDMTVGGTTDVATLEFNSLSGTGAVTITDILDEDNLASNSATKLATQQSIKAYVDAQVDTVDTLAEILAIGNRTSGTGKIEIRDAAIFINSSTNGQLDLVADTEIQLAATTVDINGAVDMSSTLTIAGAISLNDGTDNFNIGVTTNKLTIKSTTSDGSDDTSILIDAGAGGESSSRGGYIEVHGNETSADPGKVIYQMGSVSGSTHEFRKAGGNNAVTINSAGRVGILTAAPLSGLHISDGTNAGSPQNANRAATLLIDAGATASADIQFMVRNGYNSHIFFGDAADPNVGILYYDHTANDMVINTNASECARFISEGGITFNGDTAAANALNDYEEGTYTATVTPSTSGSIGLSSGFGSYTKIGNLVTVNASCNTNAISSPVGFFKVNLPFTCNTANQNGRAAASIYIDGLAGNKTSEFIGLTVENTTECRVYLGDSNLNQSDSAQRIDASTYILISVTYRTT